MSLCPVFTEEIAGPLEICGLVCWFPQASPYEKAGIEGIQADTVSRLLGSWRDPKARWLLQDNEASLGDIYRHNSCLP